MLECCLFDLMSIDSQKEIGGTIRVKMVDNVFFERVAKEATFVNRVTRPVGIIEKLDKIKRLPENNPFMGKFNQEKDGDDSRIFYET